MLPSSAGVADARVRVIAHDLHFQASSDGSDSSFSILSGDVCRVDWNAEGALNSQDFFDFINDFFAGVADFNSSGLTDSQDLFDFLAALFTGC